MKPIGLKEPACCDATRFGGKIANLARLAAQYRVPPGFCIPAGSAYTVNSHAIEEAYSRIGEPPVAVRSSAIGEDSLDASFAGQHETFLNVRGFPAVRTAILKCEASGRAAHAVAYRERRTGAAVDTRVAVLVQEMVLADASAVVFSANPVSGKQDEIVATSNWGLCESIVSGAASPDTVIFGRATLDIRSCQIGEKRMMTIAAEDGVQHVSTPRSLRAELSLTRDQLTAAARLALDLEGQLGVPVDIECSWAGGNLYLLQCRPITTLRKEMLEC